MLPRRRAAALLAVLMAGAAGLAGARAQDASQPATAPGAATPAAPAAPAPAAPAPAAEAPVAPAPAPEAPAVEAAKPPLPDDPVAAAIATKLAEPNLTLLRRFGRREREALQAFYALGAFKPIWIVDRAWTEAARAVIARLGAAAEDGLDPLDYPVPALGVPTASPADLADAELRLSAAAALYARDARGGRLDPPRLSRLITPKLDLPLADAVLPKLATAGAGADALLHAYNPAQPGYLALKARLAALRARQPGGAVPMVRLPKGPVLKPGMRDARVPLIRARFGLGSADDATAYDAAVAGAIERFQRERGLAATGILDPRTVAALAGPSPGRQEADLLANMERWRWLPAELGRKYVWVNIPDLKVRVMEGGRVVDEARVIVGKPDSPTPIFSGEMSYAVVNPSWNVPPSILKNEFLPRLARDPSYAARLGYQVVRKGNSIAVRQPPGERNALGFIKFMFPNEHAVYLHDTPNRTLFARGARALSHGCVRVDDPFRFAEVVLGPTWPTERLKKLIGKGERTVMLPEKLPVHLAYFTLVADEAGGLREAEDLYGINARVKVALGLSNEALPPSPEALKREKEKAKVRALPAQAPAPARDARPVRDAHAPRLAAPAPRVATQAPRRSRPLVTADPRVVQPAPDDFAPPPAPPSSGWW
ncbi:Peptidoglycan-binding domain 1 protein [Methylobacterium sp. 4-46]|uniref:L,D-transpeptidase family protein n=1 Tax=unclassified Methylobacterium TaxID=2615210 RepID=UPI000152E4D6|nr:MULTISPECIES: L,D-transpeptidase family protein [Methylobacterium]ACA17556.1 Peptidoglycan-binding domain 1 protein [Methylobacterium sp. 4-46]WFT83237.1 L,D-transpeptidase family protein [Methylobacterium nodulans]